MRGASVNKAIIEWVIARKPKRWELGPGLIENDIKSKAVASSSQLGPAALRWPHL